MEMWSLLFIPYLFGLLLGQEDQPPTLRDCCRNGRNHAQKGHYCTVFPLISSSPLCRIVQEQCCSELLQDDLCTNGISMARDQGSCERPFFEEGPWDNLVSKMCCDCCLMGLMTADQGLDCTLGLSMVKRCEYAAQRCCSKNFTVEPKPVTQAPVPEKPLTTTTTTKPYGEQGTCRVSNCSQLCVRNGICSCHAGYKLKADGVNCEDVNECLTGNRSCVSGPAVSQAQLCLRPSCVSGPAVSQAQLCINTVGSFRCQREHSCGTGYELTDPNKCQDINECVARTSPCQAGHTCVNTVGSYTCQSNTIVCVRGYRLSDNGTLCEDVDECREGDVCRGHSCANLVGSYRCVCRPGFTFNSFTKRCEDVNECRQYTGRLCAHTCNNTEGSYQCSCAKGFKLAQDKRNCEDVNECEAKPCSQECANVHGSYRCYCRRGYQLSETDKVTCQDIDECSLSTGGHGCFYRCANSPGSFTCTCPQGYTLAPNGRTCQDVNECVTGSHTCSINEDCFNVKGGFRCLTFRCPPNFQQSSMGLSEDGSFNLRCLKACGPYNTACAQDPVYHITHTVLSLPIFTDFNLPQEILFLRTMTPVNPASVIDAPEVYFDILSADEKFSFDVVRSSDNDMVMGVVRQVRPIVGPQDIVVQVVMNYAEAGLISHRGLVVVHALISEFWF